MFVYNSGECSCQEHTLTQDSAVTLAVNLVHGH